jgi:hypothetical protein
VHRDSISTDTDTAYGQLLRRMPVTDDRSIDVYTVSSDGQVRPITGAGNQLHELGDRATPLATGLRSEPR